MRLNLKPHLFTICLLFVNTLAIGLEKDNKEKFYITADTIFYNYKTGVHIFDGHAKADQGNTHLNADRIVTKTKHHSLQEAIAYGVKEPAHYWTLLKSNGKVTHAWASIIKYRPVDASMVLENNALVIQGENSFKGELIHYNSKTQTVIVPASQHGRSVLVYNPDK